MQGRLLSVSVWMSCWFHHVFFNSWKGQWVGLECNKWLQGFIPALWRWLYMLQGYALGWHSKESCKLLNSYRFTNVYVCRKNFLKLCVCVCLCICIYIYICVCVYVIYSFMAFSSCWVRLSPIVICSINYPLCTAF